MKRAICNEMFGDMDFSASCALLAENGFHGVEIAPFTLFGNVERIDRQIVGRVRSSMREHGIEFAGLHWLFARPEGLHVTSPDASVRRQAWDHLRRLLELAGELGGGNLIFGSPKQREARDVRVGEAKRFLVEGLREIAPFAAEHRSAVLLEALSNEQTRVVNTMAETREIVEEIGAPSVSSMFDFHNCSDELLLWEDLVARYAGIIRHVHLNDWDGTEPGPERAEYRPAFDALRGIGYDGWVSLEIFYTPEDPGQVVARTRRFMDAMAV